MRRNKSIFYSKISLMIINFIAIVYNASIYLFATNYVVAKGYAHSLLAYYWSFIIVRNIQTSYPFMIKWQLLKFC